MKSVSNLITAPTDAVVTLDEVKAHLRVDHTDDDIVIQGFIDAVVGEIDPAAGGWLGRALRPQTWELRLSSFWHQGASDRFGRIELPYPVLKSVTSVKYDDFAGVEQTLAVSTDYRVIGAGRFQKAYIAPVYNRIWPMARYDIESVRIRYVCGYDLTPNDLLPARIKAWIKLIVGSLYENRESMVIGVRETIAQLPDHILQLIHSYRVHG